MITLLHGDNIEASREELLRLVDAAKGKELRRLDGNGLDATLLTQALESSSLFGGDTCIVVERLFGGLGKKQKMAEAYAAILKRASGDVIVWETKELGPSILASLGTKVKAQLFKTPRVVFQFLDGLRPNEAAKLLVLYRELTKTNPAELVFAMLTKRVRQLTMLKDGVMPEGLQSWQATRLTNQAKAFTMSKLLAMHRKLLDSEYSLKTGASPFSLPQLTQQWIVSLDA
jgi:DNA polymerase III delta subunit